MEIKKEHWLLKENIKPVYSGDIWYDFTDGGYIQPEDFLADKDQIEKVNNARKLIISFLDFLEEKRLIGEEA